MASINPETLCNSKAVCMASVSRNIANLEKLDIFKLASGCSLYQEHLAQGLRLELNSVQQKTKSPRQCISPIDWVIISVNFSTQGIFLYLIPSSPWEIFRIILVIRSSQREGKGSVTMRCALGS